MDDFPRMPNTQAHVDCQAWMYLFAHTMNEIAQILDYVGYDFGADAKKIK